MANEALVMTVWLMKISSCIYHKNHFTETHQYNELTCLFRCSLIRFPGGWAQEADLPVEESTHYALELVSGIADIRVSIGG